MSDLGAIPMALTSLKTSADLAKAMLGLRDANLVREKALELTAEIMSAQQSTLAAQSAQSALHEEIRSLKEQIRKFEDWDSEKTHYWLHKLPSGTFAYMADPNRKPSQPEHYICARCYEDRRKSILQAHDETVFWQTNHMLRCTACSSDIVQSITHHKLGND